MAIADLPKKDERFRNCCMIVYPESVIEDWIEILREKHIPFVVSPLHDKDLDPEAPPDYDGDLQPLPKKPHYHVAFLCDGNHTLQFFQELADLIHAYKKVFKIYNVRSMLRYFCHLDNPEKFQYPESEMKAYCGADPTQYMEMGGRTLMYECKKIQSFIKGMKFTSFQAFTDYLNENGLDDWYYIVTSQRTLYFATLLRDIHFINKEKYNET